MTSPRHRSLLALPLVGALALAGCATSSDSPTDAGASDGIVQVVASTNVYGQIAEQIGGEHVEVTSIVTSGAQDPHSYEASAQDQLHVTRAALIIENGGGYDAFVDSLIESTGSDAEVVTAVEFSHDWPENDGHAEEAADHAEDAADTDDDHAENEADHDEADHDDHDHDHGDHGHVEGFNEHVWYDPHTIVHVAEGIAAELSELRPDYTAEFEANLASFAAEIEELETSLADIGAAHPDTNVFVTEPVAGYLVAAAGLNDVAPASFSEAVEEGQDVPPATLLEAQKLLRSGDVRAVVVNAQTGGAETESVISEAESASIPVVEFTETLPEGETYFSWMQDNIKTLASALEK